MPTKIDASFIDSLPANVAVQFLERVAKSPAARGLPLPRGRRLEVRLLEAGRRGRQQDRRRAPGAGRSRPSSGSGSPPARATSGSSPTSASCAPARRRRRCTPPPTRRTRRTSSATPSARSSSPRTTPRSPSSPPAGPSCRTLHKVVTFDGTADGDWVDHHRRPREARRGLPRRAPGRHRGDRQGHQRRPARHPDLHLRYDGPAEGRPAAAQLVGLRGRGHPGPGHPQRGRPRVPLAADGALVRQGA